MNKTARFSTIKFTLASLGFEPSRDSAWLDSPMRADGFLRVCLEEGDERLELYRFNPREMMMWSLNLQIQLPGAVLAAALDSALADVGISCGVPQLLAA